MTFGTHKAWYQTIAVLCAMLLALGDLPAQAPSSDKAAAEASPPAEKPPKSADQLDTLVAPIALYPDPLLAQVLAATTYPLEIVQCRRWLLANAKLKGEELTKAAQKEPWDPAVQALVAFPEALKLLDEKIQWTTELGDAFLTQQSEVMDAVQRMRKKAKDGGKLESSKEQKVEVKVVESKTVIEIQPSDPQVIYVPTYNPTVVYPPPVYPYPPYYPAYPAGGYVATAAISFGVGVAMGAFWSGGGGWGWGCGWGGNNNITINNNFSSRNGYANINGGNRTNVSGGRGNGNSWQHNPEHRKSVPYSNRDAAQKFGGGDRDSRGGRDRNGQSRASQVDRGGSNRDGRDGSRDLGNNRGGGQAGTRDIGGGQDRVGNRSIDTRDRGSQGSAFGGGESRQRTQAASNRGASSTRSSGSFGGGGGGSRGGGGGSRGGGRRR